MKSNFNATQGQPSSKGDKVSNPTWMHNKRRDGRSEVVRVIHAQTVCESNITNAMFNAVVTQWKTKEGITYYTARATKNRYMEDQYCYARIQIGPRVRVTKAKSNLWYFTRASDTAKITDRGDKCPF